MSLTTFAVEALADFRTVGAIAPSSRYLTQAMLGPVALTKARTVVEVGAGTGVMTRALLKIIPRDATLLAFEINPKFSNYLQSNVTDPRLEVIHASAEDLEQELFRRGHERVDAVVSSLALAFMFQRQRHSFLSSLGNHLGESGVFTQFHYLHGLQFNNGQLRRFPLVQLLNRYFGRVERRIIWRNLPPAFVFECRRPLQSGTFAHQ